ncbi:MAG: hypothetical protein V9E87_12590 [Gemmatimonadales bacterium]
MGTLRLGGRALRAAGLALALLGAVAGTVAWRLFRVERLAPQVVAESVTEATAARDRLLGVALASATRAADNALQRLASGADRAPLADLAADGTIERAIAVVAGDSVLALMGPHRVSPKSRPRRGHAHHHPVRAARRRLEDARGARGAGHAAARRRARRPDRGGVARARGRWLAARRLALECAGARGALRHRRGGTRRRATRDDAGAS